MFKRIVLLLVPIAAAMAAAAQAQELPYKEGPVVDVTPIRVADGKFFDYWSFLETHWRPTMEEAKKEGVILSYSVLAATPRTPQEANLILVVTYPNFASLDTIDAKMNAIEQKLFGNSPQKSEQQSGARGPIRTVLGDEIYRELQFKK